MTKPDCWVDYEMLFKKTIRSADSRTKAEMYVYTCAARFLEMGYSSEDVDAAVELMKKAVWEWEVARLSKEPKKDPGSPPSGDVGKDIKAINVFEPCKTYWFKMSGDHAQKLQHRLKAYDDNLVSKRKDPTKGPKDTIPMTLVKSAYAV